MCLSFWEIRPNAPAGTRKRLRHPSPCWQTRIEGVYRRFGLEKALFVMQRTASVVVDRQGVIRYIKRATNPMTWLQESRELLDVVRALG